MKIRDRLNKQVRWVYPLLFLAMSMFILGGVLTASHIVEFPWPMMLGFAIALPVFICMIFGIKCPNCRKLLFGSTWAVGGKIFSVGKRMRFCPRCGVDFDSDMKPKESSNHGIERIQ